MPLLADGASTWLFLLALLVTIGWILFRTGRRVQQAARANPSSLQVPSRTPTAPVPREAQDWQIELHEFTRDVTARIDSKMAALEHLLRAAHHEALRLEALLAQAHPLIPGAAEEALPASRAVDAVLPPNQAQALEDALGAPRPVVPPRPAGSSPRPYEQIYALADAGLDAERISEQAGCPVGEVQLILGLRPRR